MSTKWTEEQREAIFTKNCNLLVAAGAGAGKTAVLVERIIQRIVDDKEAIDIDKLLVVTFTNAAAAEMRERIGDAISKQLEARPESKKLQRQLTLLNQSNIMTIHSFCLQVIKNNFHVIDIDPSFRVSDNTEAILLKQETIDELFEDKYEESNNEIFLKLVDAYGGKNDFKVQSMVLNLYEFAKSTPWPKLWLSDMAERFNVSDDFNFGDSEWANILLSYLNIEVEACKSKMEKAVEIVENAAGIEYYLEPFNIELQNIYSILHCNSWEDLKRNFSELSFEKIPVKRNKDADKEAKEKSKKIRDEVKKKLSEIKENIFTGTDSIGNNLRELYPMMKCLAKLVMSFDEKYSIKKRERGIVDFSDIEHFCLNILTSKDEDGNIVSSQVALEYKQQFEEILIDEYQDSNEVQEVIMNAISRKNDIPNMFMVGDVKQSIYRFRQAKPELFLGKYNRYSEERGTEERKIKLFKNFRSRPEIINGVNYLFEQIMSKEIGELEYDEGEALKSGAEYPKLQCDEEIIKKLEKDEQSEKEACEYNIKNICGGDIELHLIDKQSNDVFEMDDLDTNEAINVDLEEETADNIQIEARLVAKRIKELLDSNSKEKFNVYDKDIKGYRPVRYKDIVILMRATSNWAPTFVEELTNASIPVFADTATGYFETVEIRTIMSLLQIIDNPIQDIPLIAVLRSPIEAFEPEELMDIRMVNKDISFYEAMKAIENDKVSSEKEEIELKKYTTEHISQELKDKVLNFLNKLNKWRKKVLHIPIDEFIWYLYIETGYYGFVGAIPGGPQRQANLRILFERAKQYEKTSYKGLFNFINFVNKLKSSSGDMGSAKILGENEDVVRIMSIHKSKGLEFPIVILAGAGKQFNLMDMNRSILFHGELGLGPDYVDPDRRISYPTVVKQVLKRKIKVETLSEEMRILYVAFTRAKEKLIITGTINNIVNTAEKWYEAAARKGNKISEYAIGNAKSYLDWIGPAMIRHICGKNLREIIGKENVSEFVIDDRSRWSIKTWNKESFMKKVNLDDEEDQDIIKEIESASLTNEKSKYNQEISRRLNWEYEYMKSSDIPAKFSVSELKRKFTMIDVDESREMISSVVLKKPIFIQKKRTLSAAEKGTLLHLVMQHLELDKVSSNEEIMEQVKRLIQREFITEKEGKVVQIDKILKFFKTDLGQRMKNAKNVYRETPFFIEVSAVELYKDLPKELYENEKVLIQGIIDCYFEEDDKLVLLDYKTDFVEDINRFKEKYNLQIYYYKRALEKMTGKSIKNTYLYSFFKDEVIEI